jgi:hypothetical protein
MSQSPQSHGERRWTNDRIPCRSCWRIAGAESPDGLCAICRQTTSGRRLAAARELAGYSVLRLAQMLEVPTSALLDAEKGLPLRRQVVRPLCKALGVTAAEIWPHIYGCQKPS